MPRKPSPRGADTDRAAGRRQGLLGRLLSVGYGETQPIANNDTAQGRERNRRIDIIIEPQLESAP